jgi:hypothetical protein
MLERFDDTQTTIVVKRCWILTSCIGHRPLDNRFTIDQIESMTVVNDSNTSFLTGLVDVAGYEKGGWFMFESAVNSDRYLLTFENACHNIAAAPPRPI